MVDSVIDRQVGVGLRGILEGTGDVPADEAHVHGEIFIIKVSQGRVRVVRLSYFLAKVVADGGGGAASATQFPGADPPVRKSLGRHDGSSARVLRRQVPERSAQGRGEQPALAGA